MTSNPQPSITSGSENLTGGEDVYPKPPKVNINSINASTFQGNLKLDHVPESYKSELTNLLTE
jgi:hypothetical protein